MCTYNESCLAFSSDVLVWSNARVIRWVNDIGLSEYAEYLRQSGVHGAIIALDENFDLETLAYYLQIPSTNETVSITSFVVGICSVALI